MDISSMVGSRHYLLCKVILQTGFARTCCILAKITATYIFIQSCWREKRETWEVKILNPIQLLRQLCKILPQSHKRIQVLWICSTLAAPAQLTCNLVADLDSREGKAGIIVVMVMVLGNNIYLLCCSLPGRILYSVNRWVTLRLFSGGFHFSLAHPENAGLTLALDLYYL